MMLTSYFIPCRLVYTTTEVKVYQEGLAPRRSHRKQMRQPGKCENK